MPNEDYVIGVDYGTDSVRTIIVDAATGEEAASAVHYYTRWREGRYCDAGRSEFRQHPLDYLEGLEATITGALAKVPRRVAENIRGISVDTTGSTPVAVDRAGTPLALLDEFRENPNAMFILWKDHTAVREAGEITALCRSWGGDDYTKYIGGIYSSEWFWAKILHTLRVDATIRERAFSWVEHCDWIPAVLTGQSDARSIKRSRCAAGHKAMWHPSWSGLPSEEFLMRLDPLLKGLRADLFTDTFTSDERTGTLSEEWSRKLGLKRDVVVGVGAFDAHMGAVGAESRPYDLCKVIGTSTCDMLIAPIGEVGDKLVRGICGQVEGSIAPGMIGMEAGQSAFGDVYAWFQQLPLWPVRQILQGSELVEGSVKDRLIAELEEKMVPLLSAQAEKIPVDESGLIALDWVNGRRTPGANQNLKGAITGLHLGSDAPRVFRALVEATAFGAKRIVERFISEGVKIEGVIALGGVPKRSPFVMQVLADVLGMPIKVARSEQTCALGAAMFAAVSSGVHSNIEAAQARMGTGFEVEYFPNQNNTAKYASLYAKYVALGMFVENELTGSHE